MTRCRSVPPGGCLLVLMTLFLCPSVDTTSVLYCPVCIDYPMHLLSANITRFPYAVADAVDCTSSHMKNVSCEGSCMNMTATFVSANMVARYFDCHTKEGPWITSGMKLNVEENELISYNASLYNGDVQVQVEFCRQPGCYEASKIRSSVPNITSIQLFHSPNYMVQSVVKFVVLLILLVFALALCGANYCFGGRIRAHQSGHRPNCNRAYMVTHYNTALALDDFSPYAPYHVPIPDELLDDVSTYYSGEEDYEPPRWHEVYVGSNDQEEPRTISSYTNTSLLLIQRLNEEIEDASPSNDMAESIKQERLRNMNRRNLMRIASDEPEHKNGEAIDSATIEEDVNVEEELRIRYENQFSIFSRPTSLDLSNNNTPYAL